MTPPCPPDLAGRHPMTLVPAAPDPTSTLLAALDLVPYPGEPDTFSGVSLPRPGGRVFGGQVLAQALIAAGRTLPDPARLPHSLHGYFLRAGDASEPIDFAVERLRDGRSFSARHTHAFQGGVPILSMVASFQAQQDGLDYADPMPSAPDPDDVGSTDEVLAGIDHPVAKFWTQESAFDVRHVNGSIYLGPHADTSGRQLVWVRSRNPIPDDQLLHRALLAYACDQVMLEPVLRRSGNSWMTRGLSIASLDHAMWWHRDVHVDEWLLFAQSSPSAQGGRGLGASQVFSRDGALVASIAQEGMVRVPSS